jgi:hypothetical protein
MKGLVPLAVRAVGVVGNASEPGPGSVSAPFAPFGGNGLTGDSARADRRLSREGDSRKLLDEARGDGRPSLLDKLRLNPEKAFEGEGTCANPPWILCLRRPSIVPKRLFNLDSII